MFGSASQGGEQADQLYLGMLGRLIAFLWSAGEHLHSMPILLPDASRIPYRPDKFVFIFFYIFHIIIQKQFTLTRITWKFYNGKCVRQSYFTGKFISKQMFFFRNRVAASISYQRTLFIRRFYSA